MNRTVFFLLMMGALTARADILGSGGEWGLIEPNASFPIISTAADPADSGAIRLGNNQCIAWEADPTGTDETLCVNANEWLVYSGPIISETGVGGYLVSQDSTNPGNASGEGYVNFKAYTDTLDDNIVMSQIALDVTDASDGTEDADLLMSTIENGALTEYMRLDASAGTVDVSTNLSVDFHNNLCLDGVACTTYIAEEVDNYLYFYAGGNKQLVLRDNAYNMYTAGAALDNYIVRTGTPATDVDIQVQRFYGESSNGTDTEFVAVSGGIAEHTQGDVDGVWELEVKNDNSHVSVIKADMSDGVETVAFGVLAVASAGLQHHNGTSLPATCVVGQVFLDTDSDDCADTGSGDGCICICKSTDTWAVVQDI